MKHFLLKFSLLSVTFCAAIACKNTNSTTNELSARKLPFDNSVYFTVPHLEGRSSLRKKLLNQALAIKLKSNVEMNESQEIKKDDTKFSTSNLTEYKNFKKNAAEVIVSFRDRLEIYFVPNGISREKAFQQLALEPESDASFFWIGSSDAYLMKEKSYFLISTTNKEMRENDVYFNNSVENLGSDFNELYFSFSSSQIISLKVKAEYFIKETTYALLTGNRNRCRGSDWESGNCGSCEYKMEAPTGALIKTTLDTASFVDLDIIINGRSYPLLELRPLKDKDGNFIVTLDLKKIVTTDLVTIEFRKNLQVPVLKDVIGVEYSDGCAGRGHTKKIDVTPSLKIDLEMNIQGRNLSIF